MFERGPLLPSLGTGDASSNDTRQRLTAHLEQHADGAGDQDGHQDAEAGKQQERDADVLLFARRPAPLHRLLGPVFVDPGQGRPAFTLEAVRVSLVAVAVARAKVGGVLARRLGGEAAWDDGREGEVRRRVRRGDVVDDRGHRCSGGGKIKKFFFALDGDRAGPVLVFVFVGGGLRGWVELGGQEEHGGLDVLGRAKVFEDANQRGQFRFDLFGLAGEEAV